MEKKSVLSSISFLLLLCIAAAAAAETEEKKLGVTFDVTYLSRWLSRGATPYGQQGSIVETIDVDLYGTGFGFNIAHRSATGSGYVAKERLDYTPYYKSKLFEGTSYLTKYDISLTYKQYPRQSSDNANTTFEWIFGFSWPEILPGSLVPYYIAHYEYPAPSNDKYRYITGWVHRFGLGYDLKVAELLNPLRLSSEIAYTDGLGGAAHDWSYATFGIATKLEITKNLTFVPGLYEQITMDDSVNKQHEITYCMLSMKYKF
jgi:hypothetical protein